MDTYFKDKVIWLTGASSGIGEALVYALAPFAPRMVLSSRKAAELQRVAKRSGLPETHYLILPLDLADDQKMPDLARQVLDHFGRIDILINNGGISQRGAAIDTDISVDKKIMDVNFTGTVALTKAVLPGMIAARSGQIVTVGSVAGVVSTPKRTSYAAAKAALIAYMDALRAEMHPYGLHIGMINPGYVRTNISINALMGDGSPQGTMDQLTDKGLSPEKAVKKMLRAIRRRKDQVYIAGTREMLGVYIKKISPALLRIIVRKVNAT
ncbi:MAG: SDR family oxidoreductase [Saprospiraceae bacterium]|nr:SDR family oxidoreductase [Lewinella sp.]